MIPHHHAGACDCEPTIAYIRVSRVGDRQVLISPDIQLDSIYVDCRSRGKRVVKIVSDIDKTGRTFLKRSVGQVIEYVKTGIAKSVTVWKWSRWGRNLEYSLAYLSQVQAVGGRVDSATDDIEQKTATGRFSRDMIMRIDQLTSDLIGEGWQAAHARRREAGLPHSGRARFGYLYVSRAMKKAHAGWEECERCAGGEPHFVIHPVEGPRLKLLYEKYNSGNASLKQLTRDLNADGFRTPLDGNWTPQALGQMLDTGFAAGYLRERSQEMLEQIKATGKAPRNGLTTFDVWRKGAHAALISEDDWTAYKRRRLSQAGLPPRARNGAHAASALVFCELCARRMSTKYPGRKKAHTWACDNRAAFHPTVSVSITNAALLGVVESWVVEQADPAMGGDVVDDLARRLLKSGGESIRTVDEVQREIEAEVKALDKLILMNARGRISDERFAVVQVDIEEKLGQLREELARLIEPVRASDKPTYEAFGALAERWSEMQAQDPSLLNGPLRELVAFIVVSPASGRGVRVDPATRVEVVGTWEAESKERWLSARRRRYSA